MADEAFDLDAYLTRISYGGPREPSLPVLAAVIAAHATTIPYEDVDVLLGRDIRLDPSSLQQKLVDAGRGGYCYEQNSLIEAALLTLGFRVRGLVGRVIRSLADTAPAPRNHKILLVELPDGPFIADVGFGNLTPTAPLALRVGEVQPTSHEAFRLIALDDEFIVQARLGERWDSLYRFAIEKVLPVDYEMANWFTSTRPSSPFRSNLIVARASAGGRATLYNRRLALRDRENRVERRVLDGIDDYRAALAEHFGLILDEADLAAVARLMASHPPDEEVHRAFS